MQRNCELHLRWNQYCDVELCDFSAANDFWGSTFMGLTGQSKMDQKLAILTGSSAGATESFVVVPFELVKIKYEPVEPCFTYP